MNKFQVRTDKPQGFEVGKLKKKGIHTCYYNCGAVFKSEAEAKEHSPCPGRKESDDTVAKIWKLGKLKKEEEAMANLKESEEEETYEDSDEETQEDSDETEEEEAREDSEDTQADEEETEEEDETQDERPTPASVTRNASVFDALPKETSEERVIWFLITSENPSPFA